MLRGIPLIVAGVLVGVGLCWFIVATDWSPWLALPILMLLGALCSTSLFVGIDSISPVTGPTAGLQEIDRWVPITICVNRDCWRSHVNR